MWGSGPAFLCHAGPIGEPQSPTPLSASIITNYASTDTPFPSFLSPECAGKLASHFFAFVADLVVAGVPEEKRAYHGVGPVADALGIRDVTQ